jgi:outer membrane protein assembly factor BamB
VVGDLVMAITGNGCDDEGKVASPKAPSFIAINKKTGKLAWQSNLPGEKIIEGQFSNPTLAQVNGKPQVIFAGGDGVLYGFEPTKGDLIWKCDCLPNRKPKTERGIDNHFIATPVVVGDRLYVGMGICPETGQHTKTSYFLCLDITRKGDVSLKSYDAKSPANKNSALVWAHGGLIEPRPDKGRESRLGSTMSTAAVHDGLVYIAEERGQIQCLDAATGQRYWEHDSKAVIWGSPYWVDGKVYFGTEEGTVLIFAHGKQRKGYFDGNLRAPTPEDDKKRQPGVSMNEGESIQGTPIVANGVLYVPTKAKIYAIAGGK